MPDWLTELILPLVFIAIACFLVYLLVVRIVRAVKRLLRAIRAASRGALAALTTGGLSLFSKGADSDLWPPPNTKPKTRRSLVLNALASGGVSLFYTDPPAAGSSGDQGPSAPVTYPGGSAVAGPEAGPAI